MLKHIRKIETILIIAKLSRASKGIHRSEFVRGSYYEKKEARVTGWPFSLIPLLFLISGSQRNIQCDNTDKEDNKVDYRFFTRYLGSLR